MGTGTYNIIPEGENHCVWMDAGLVNYKLCDRNFECETCAFDTIMKSQHHAFAERATVQSEEETARVLPRNVSDKIFSEVVHQLIAPLKNITLPNDRLYFANHSWMMRLSNKECKIGIDGFLAHLLKPLMGVIVINPPASLEKESPFAWVIRDDETFSLHSSVAGTVVQINSTVTAKPMLLTTDPYEQGWILTLSPLQGKEEAAKCFSCNEFSYRMNKDIEKIEMLLASTFTKQRKEVGASLFDGGTRIETIEQFIGEKRYTQLLSRLLHPHSR